MASPWDTHFCLLPAGYAQMANLVVDWMHDLENSEASPQQEPPSVDEAYFLRVRLQYHMLHSAVPSGQRLVWLPHFPEVSVGSLWFTDSVLDS